MIHTIGIDPGLRHGAVVYAEWEFLDGIDWCLREPQLLYSWTKKHSVSIGQKSPPQEVYRLANMINQSIAGNVPKGTPIAIDWSRYSVHYKSRKLQAVQLAFFLGYLARAVQAGGHPVVFFSPHEVRSKMDMGAGDKAAAWRWFIGQVEPIELPTLTEDQQDALILSYVMARSMETPYAAPAPISLPSA